MSWNHERSLQRIRTHLGGMGEITVRKLVREADLETLLSETECREIFGAHVYVQVSNFAKLASAATDDADQIRRLIQAVHVYQREVSRIVEASDLFDGVRVHFQGAKLHALFYRPVDDARVIATRAVLLQWVLREFVQSVFNPAFAGVSDFRVAGGCDIGNAIGTQNGMRGDRELLFIGSPANHAAKIVGPVGSLRLTSAVRGALPPELRQLTTEVEGSGGRVYSLDAIPPALLAGLCRSHGVAWDRERSRERVDQDRRTFPLRDISFSDAEARIDLDTLGVKNSKRVLAASIFADVSGFTAYVDRAGTEQAKRAALRVFHAMRKELAQVLTSDFDGVRVQYQGDRIQAVFHLPRGDAGAIARRVLRAAGGVQASMEMTLKACLPEAAPLSLAVGVDIGTTLVSKLGTRGARDAICLGESVEAAAAIEERVPGDVTGISGVVHDALPSEMKELFAWDAAAGCFVARGLTADRMERALEAGVYASAGTVFLRSGVDGIRVSSQQGAGARAVIPSSNYGR